MQVRRRSLGVVGGLVLLAGLVAPAFACVPRAMVEVRPSVAFAGDVVTVSASGFATPGETFGPVELHWESTLLTVAAGPSFELRYVVPPSTRAAPTW